MGAYGSVAITPGAGETIYTYTKTGGQEVQIVRENGAESITRNVWTVATTASTSQIAADANRVQVLMVSIASSRVYLNFSSTAPTATAYDWYLDPGDRWEVPICLSEQAVSMLGVAVGGTISSLLGVTA